MATELTWACDANHTNEDQTSAANMTKWTVWYLAHALVGDIGGLAAGLWSVHASCDGTTAGTMGDGVDRWGSTFDAAKLVPSAAGAHSWMVLESPAALGPYYLILDCNTASASNIAVVFCKAAPTGGTTTARPTSTDEWTYSPWSITNNSVTSNHRVNMHLSEEGAFFFLETFDGAGAFRCALALLPLQDPSPDDDYPVVSLCLPDSSASPTLTSSSYVLPNVANTTLKSRKHDGSAVLTCVAPAPAVLSSGNELWLFGSTSGVPGANASDATYNEFPIFICGVGANSEFKGRAPDLKWASGSAPITSPRPAVAPYEYAVIYTNGTTSSIGGIWGPWVASVAPAV